MSTKEDLSLSPLAKTLPWLLFIESEIKDTSIGLTGRRICNAFKSLLLGKIAAVDVVRLIDTAYDEHLLAAHSMTIDQDDEDMGGFLDYLWGLLFDIAMRLPYNDPGQDRLIQFIVELRKLPPKPSEFPGVDSLIFAKEPVFGLVLNDRWNANHISEAIHFKSTEDLKETCDQWVNFSTFLARCKGSGLATQFGAPCVHAGDDIEDGLEKELPNGVVRDCKIMVAAQYVLLAGKLFSEELFGQDTHSGLKEWGHTKWPIWSQRLKKFALQYEEDGNTELAIMTREAYEKMFSLSP